jgi:hypothetical protein
MIPETGSTALFTFKLRFDSLNGVYRIRAKTTFRDAITAGVSFGSNLYVPAGLAASDFDTDYPTYLTDVVAVLESVRDTSVVYYVPESVFATVPDPTIKEYFPLNAVINLGVFSNTQAIYPLLDQIKDLVQSSVGVTDPLYLLTNPDNKVYLTDAQYAAVEEARQENTQKLVPLKVQLDQALLALQIMSTKVSLYEKLLAKQSS